jgi:FemAB-related protein (PEP-CTERM system-associated)
VLLMTSQRPRTLLRIETDVPQAGWDAYVAARTESRGPHRWAWRGVLARTFGHRTHGFAACDGGEIVGILPLVLYRSRMFGRYGVSMPCLDYGGVLADSPDIAERLLEAAIGVARAAGARHLELRHTARLFPGLPCRTHKVAMRLALESTEARQWQALDRKVRNQVRRAEKEGLRVERGGAELSQPFYQVFAENMRDLGTPVYPRRFFEEIVRTFPEHAQLFAVWQGDRPLAGSIVFAHDDSLQVMCASALRRFNRLCPNMLLYWEMVRFAIACGLSRFDFGRSTPGGGTYEFKRQWGAEPEALYWEYWLRDGGPLPDLSPTNTRYQLAIRLWQRLPVAVTRIVGPQIVRNLP